MSTARVTFAIVFAVPACGGTLYGMDPAAVQTVRLPPDPPPPGAYVPDLPASPRVAACMQRGYDAPDLVTCLEATDDESAICALLPVGVADEVIDKHPATYPTPFHDKLSAAEAAGRLAAKTSPRELYAMMKDPSFPIEGFAAQALATFLSAALPGSSEGEGSAAAHACAPLLASPEARVAMSAALCVGASKDPSALPALAQAFVARTEASFRAQVGPLVVTSPKGAVAEETVRALDAFIKAPLPDPLQSEDRDARDFACGLVAAQLQPAPDWAVEDARIAYVTIEQKTGDKVQRCAELGGMNAPSTPPPANAAAPAADAGVAPECPSSFRDIPPIVAAAGLTCHCSAVTGSVWGSSVYTRDSSVCAAATHAGAVTSMGGVVTAIPGPACPSYTGSTRNGVTSSDWGPYAAGSYYFRGFGTGACD